MKQTIPCKILIYNLRTSLEHKDQIKYLGVLLNETVSFKHLVSALESQKIMASYCS